jgi:glycosyltransferase involved in cell wall biosynthesis
MVDPFITTIIPTYNRARELVLAVESALAQRYPADRHEILVVDDGSQDEGATEVAMQPYAHRIRYLRKENGGVSSARNYGMANGRGDLYAFLDSDDEWLPDKLRKQADFLETHPHCGIVQTDFIRIDQNRRPVGLIRHSERFPDDRPNLTQALRFPGLPPSTVMVRRTVIDDVGGFDTTLRTAEDIEFQLRVARRYGIGVVPEPLVRYKMGHDDGLSHGRGTYRDFMAVICKFARDHRDEIEPAFRHAVLVQNYVKNARGLITGGWYQDGVRFALEGARHVRGVGDAMSVANIGLLLARHATVQSMKRLGRV